ncbi:MAG: DUF4917 family protein [Bacteroidales bacterium]|nr:DUF4917 family protein [Bacteroidales bacterium]
MKNYQQVIEYLNNKNRKKHLLMGNGFSIAYDYDIFSYNSLNSFIESIDNKLLNKLFEITDNKNFEVVMQQLDNFKEIAKVFDADKTLLSNIDSTSSLLKESLISAVKKLHPEHVFTVSEEKSRSCFQWLNEYLSTGGNIFTSNYDLLLYWVLMRNSSKHHVDGFGRDKESEEYVPSEEAEYSELRWGKHSDIQNVHYLHGALQIFDQGIEIIKEEYNGYQNLLEVINDKMSNKEYPIFITAGDGDEKLKNIMHNRYLTYCYEKLAQISGSLVTFGFNFGEYDMHIIDAINKAAKGYYDANNNFQKLYSIYIGVFSESDEKHIKSIQDKFKCKVNIFDSKTANIWG